MDQHELNGKGPWTSEEDEKLQSYVQENGARDWKTVAREIDLGRSGNSCRLRYVNYLKPGIVLGNITDEEWILILELHSELGNKWSKIAQKLPGRTDNKIKNFWNTTVLKEAKILGLEANSQEFRERMTEKLRARIQTPAALSSTITADDAYFSEQQFSYLETILGDTNLADFISSPPPQAAAGNSSGSSTAASTVPTLAEDWFNIDDIDFCP